MVILPKMNARIIQDNGDPEWCKKNASIIFTGPREQYINFRKILACHKRNLMV